MFFPYSTDAPIYHWPIATVGLIAINVSVYFATFGATPEQVEPFILFWGAGLHPEQWLTSMFLHAGFFHLLGNMMCLWGFGIVVEGKIGWWRFLTAYMLIGVLQSMIEQTLMLGAGEGGSLGASAAIFGVMTMALVWAPKHEMTCLILIFFRPFEFDCSIAALAGFLFVLQLITWSLTVMLYGGDMFFAMTSEALHMMGAVLGFACATVMLKQGWVDCEHWDMYSVIAGKHTMSDDERAVLRTQSQDWQEKQQRRIASAQKQIREIMDQGNPEMAYKAHRKMAHTLEDWQLPDADFLKLILTFHEQKKWSDSIEPMVEYLRQQREHERQVRLKLAHILIEHAERPGQALKVLGKIEIEQLSENQRNLLKRLIHKAKQLAAADPYELADDDW